MPNSPFASSKKSTQNSAQTSLLELKKLATFLRDMYTWDVAVVTAYDHVLGTVDVRMKLDKRSLDLKGVLVWGRGGSKLRFGHALTPATFDDQGEINNQPDVGMLFYPRLDSTRALEDFKQRSGAFRPRTHGPFLPIFIPGLPVRAQDTITGLAADAATEGIDAGDSFLVSPSGAGVIIKEDGKLILKGTEVVLLGINQVYGDAQPVERSGDSSSAVVKAG